MCNIQISHTGGENILLFQLYNNSLTGATESIIRQEINSFGTINFRKSQMYLMFVSLDNTNSQTVTVTVLGALAGLRAYSFKIISMFIAAYYFLVAA